MPDLYGDVMKFMDTFGQSDEPIDRDLVNLRWGLISEEADEVADALVEVREDVSYTHQDSPAYIRSHRDHLAHLTKELCDLLYVTVGAFIALKLPYEEAWKLVQESNMAKAAGHRGPNGKWVKPDDWKPPYEEIEKLLEKKE